MTPKSIIPICEKCHQFRADKFISTFMVCKSCFYSIKHQNKIIKYSSLKTRFEILKRDNFTCQYCGRSPKKDKHVILHIDHIYPNSKKRNNNPSNLITSCFECNMGKKDVLLTNKNFP